VSDQPNRRSWARIGVALAAVILLCVVDVHRGVPPPEVATSPREVVPPGPTVEDFPLTDVDASRAIALRSRLSVTPPPGPEPAVHVEPPAAPPPPAAPSPEPPPSPTPEVAAAAPQEAAPQEQGSGTAEASEEDLALWRPREWVYPQIPIKIITKRKIDDVVVLKARVGADGHVSEVSVVRAIPNCEECTRSAVEAAMQFVFDAPAGANADLWTAPISMRFSYR
jgi:hypothetical protein